MSNKRKIDDRDDDEGAKRCRSKEDTETPNDADHVEKRAALKRLFGRISSVENDRSEEEDSESDDEVYADENEDPLLDSIPSDMDPEQLGFLVCAQETLRFLHMRGMSVEHPMFARLRSRFLRGINDLGLA